MALRSDYALGLCGRRLGERADRGAGEAGLDRAALQRLQREDAVLHPLPGEVDDAQWLMRRVRLDEDVATLVPERMALGAEPVAVGGKEGRRQPVVKYDVVLRRLLEDLEAHVGGGRDAQPAALEG